MLINKIDTVINALSKLKLEVGPYAYTDLVRTIRVWSKYGFGLEPIYIPISQGLFHLCASHCTSNEKRTHLRAALYFALQRQTWILGLHFTSLSAHFESLPQDFTSLIYLHHSSTGHLHQCKTLLLHRQSFVIIIYFFK